MCRGCLVCPCVERAGPSNGTYSAEHHPTMHQNALQMNPQGGQIHTQTTYSIERGEWMAQNAKCCTVPQSFQPAIGHGFLVPPGCHAGVANYTSPAPSPTEITDRDRDFSRPWDATNPWTGSAATEQCLVASEATIDPSQLSAPDARGMESEPANSGNRPPSSDYPDPDTRAAATLVAHWAVYMCEQFHWWKTTGNGALYQADLVRREGFAGEGVAGEGVAGQKLACPYCKRDAVKYYDCITKVLPTLARVKDHIRKNHMIPIYCSRCYTQFGNSADHDAHQRNDVQCRVVQPPKVVEGYDPFNTAHQTAMTRRADTTRTSSEQWNVLYRAFFPYESVPDSPSVDTDLLTTTKLWGRFVKEAWPGIWAEMCSKLPDLPTSDEACQREFRKQVLHAAKTGLVKNQLLDERSFGPEPAFSSSAATSNAHESEASDLLDLYIDYAVFGAN